MVVDWKYGLLLRTDYESNLILKARRRQGEMGIVWKQTSDLITYLAAVIWKPSVVTHTCDPS